MNCLICKSKMTERMYKLKDKPGDKVLGKSYRVFFSCTKSITHTYSEESLKDIDLALYEKELVHG